jgi:signal transduction histidine kinase
MVDEGLGPPRPAWVRPALAGAVLLLAGLTLLLDTCWCDRSRSIERLVLIGLVCLAWAVELARPALPRPALAAAVALPIGWLTLRGNASVAPLLLLLMVGWVVYTGRQRDGLLAAGLASAAVLGYVGHDAPDRWLPWLFGIVALWLSTRLMVVQQRLVAQLRAAQADLARQAVAAERRRIAGEIHDVAAHSLAVTLLHLTGARLRVRRLGGDAQVLAALAEAERLGRQSLDDVRRTIGLLQDAAEPAPTAPLPGATDIPALVEQYRAAGLAVALEVRGDPAELPAASGLALYRILQEALANAVKHAPGAAVRVELEVGAGARLRVSNAAPRLGSPTPTAGADGGTGLGLGGMRERAALLGGRLRAGPTESGWLVECELPGDARAGAATAAPASGPGPSP